MKTKTYTVPDLLQIAMPIGGIGSGNVCLNGYGGLQDFAIYNKPATTAEPDGHGFKGAAFALLHIKGDKPVTRLVEGPLPVEKIYDQGLQGQGYRGGGHEGIPRFAECTFENQYPFGLVHLSDPTLPVQVTLEGWNPFIPLDDYNSGIPCAILQYKIQNISAAPVALEFSYHLGHPAMGKGGERGTRNKVLSNQGVVFSNTEESTHETFGSAALAVAKHTPQIKAMWFRGGWFDSLSALWREVSTGTFATNDGSGSEHGVGGRNGGSVLVPAALAPGESITIPVVLTWYFPNCHYGVGGLPSPDGSKPVWHPWYSTQWNDAGAVAYYVIDHLDMLYQRTAVFKDALFSSTLPPAVLDAVSSNLAIMKSPTVLRQHTGKLWGWEGCFPGSGCCHGSCTHVWNYAQAFPHLFPSLERSLREQEYQLSMDTRGHINFRTALPEAPTSHDYHAAADGQLGGILKLWREWQISGDTDWLARLYPLAKRSIDFCIAAWDPEKRGALFEPHHNTYDIEFWGPDGMCSSIYIGALCAMAELADALDKETEATAYRELADKGAAFLDTELFNGSYYEHRVQWEGLRDQSFNELLSRIPTDGTADEVSLLLKAEGPKYQYGTGCLSDGVIGAWMATLYGVETPLSRTNVREHLKAIFTHNFRADLSEHACLQRPGYALGHEPGLLLCSWPREGKPTLPFVYSDEVWTGIEYQVASHCIAEGLIEEGLTIVEGVRARYEGHTRNPFNEYECGNYYARAMSSYALLSTLSGFRYSAITKTLWFGPRLEEESFTCFFSAASGFGTITLDTDTLTITMIEGELAIEELRLTRNGKESILPWSIIARVGEPARLTLEANQ